MGTPSPPELPPFREAASFISISPGAGLDKTYSPRLDVPLNLSALTFSSLSACNGDSTPLNFLQLCLYFQDIVSKWIYDLRFSADLWPSTEYCGPKHHSSEHCTPKYGPSIESWLRHWRWRVSTNRLCRQRSSRHISYCRTCFCKHFNWRSSAQSDVRQSVLC